MESKIGRSRIHAFDYCSTLRDLYAAAKDITVQKINAQLSNKLKQHQYAEAMLKAAKIELEWQFRKRQPSTMRLNS
ncbi:hypothetical protein OsccyDRAFT_3874 [Leptolyngbyaceae cyanobacterium JSC-12]|nr:hypothetical protein OsccyDRAFT_3874 [Leptolyngbyaceae cyanobacterium JSC-12]